VKPNDLLPRKAIVLQPSCNPTLGEHAFHDWTLPLMRQAIARGMPLFGICRGFQETHVALGGSLHQAVHEAAGHHDRRGAQRAPDADAEHVYGPAHPVDGVPGGVLASIGDEPRFTVNSVPGQGANRLAAGLHVEAPAPDGLLEAFSVERARGFALCVQWHPEWKASTHPVSRRLLNAFGEACRVFRDRHKAPLPSEER
jgi:putative glutamine amidotransferase